MKIHTVKLKDGKVVLDESRLNEGIIRVIK